MALIIVKRGNGRGYWLLKLWSCSKHQEASTVSGTSYIEGAGVMSTQSRCEQRKERSSRGRVSSTQSTPGEAPRDTTECSRFTFAGPFPVFPRHRPHSVPVLHPRCSAACPCHEQWWQQAPCQDKRAHRKASATPRQRPVQPNGYTTLKHPGLEASITFTPKLSRTVREREITDQDGRAP